jgi:uncharacterized membrane protein (UPF0127 family)
LLGFFYVLGLFVIEPHSNVVLADVELAQTTEQLKSGLSNRKFLGENSGMLFVCENAGKHSFWMKDMNFPVDIIWIDSDNKVIDITKDAQPCGLDECEIYRAPSAVKYVLELPAGFSQKHSIETGKSTVLSCNILAENITSYVLLQTSKNPIPTEQTICVRNNWQAIQSQKFIKTPILLLLKK